LYETLARWLPSPSARSEPAPLVPETPDTWFVVPGIDAQTGLRYFAGRAPAYEQAVRQFVTLYTPLDDFHPSTAQFDATGKQRLREALHSLSGACAVIGALPLHAQAQALGALLRGRAGEAVLRRELTALCDSLGAMVAALRTRFSGSADTHRR